MLTTAEVTTLTGLTSKTLHSWARAGHLTPVKRGRQYLWELDKIEAVRRTQGQQDLLRKLFGPTS